LTNTEESLTQRAGASRDPLEKAAATLADSEGKTVYVTHGLAAVTRPAAAWTIDIRFGVTATRTWSAADGHEEADVEGSGAAEPVPPSD
jgi:hypothetical protein